VTRYLEGMTRPVIIGVLGSSNLVPKLVNALKEDDYESIIVPDNTELQHEPSVRKWMNYAHPDAFILAQDKIKAHSASMAGSLLTGIHAFHCAMGLTKAVLFTGIWPDPEFWMLVNLGQTMHAEGKIKFGWYLKHPKSPAMLDWAKESVLAMRGLLPAQEKDASRPQSEGQRTQVPNSVVPQ
jgi:hypothetical protein